MPWVSLCNTTDLTPGQGKYVEIDGFQLAAFLHNEKFFVMDNYCPHAGGNLAGGHVIEGCAICPWHGWAFHLQNGQLRDAPGVEVRTYATRILKRENHPDLLQANLPQF